MGQTENPFGDHARSSIGTFHDFNDHESTRNSEFSFRSSHSTNIIPIAYIPPHSNSLSVDDAARGPFGEAATADRPPTAHRESVRSQPAKHASIPASVMDADLIDIQELPPALSPNSVLTATTSLSGGAPVRPTRAPGLDLELPKVATSLQSPTRASVLLGRPTSSFPFLAAPPQTSGAGARGMSVLLDPKDNRGSHLSVMSTATSRSGNSTMSYILDPPQIITPVGADGIRRVEILGRGQAGLVQVPGSSGPSALGTVAVAGQTANPFADPVVSANAHARNGSGETIKSSGNSSRWTQSTNSDPRASYAESVALDPHPPSPGHSPISHNSAFFPQSARNSEAFPQEDTGNRSRPLTGASEWSSSSSALGPIGFASESRDSFASAASHNIDSISMLDGIPFMASPPATGSGLGVAGPPASPLFPLPPTRTPSIGPPSPGASSINLGEPALTTTATSASPDLTATLADHITSPGSDGPLPAPFLPFAGQRPASGASLMSEAFGSSPAGQRVQSQAISVRTGFGSGLSDFPMQIGFPSLDGASERGSMISYRDSRTSEFGAGPGAGPGQLGQRQSGLLAGVEEGTEPRSSRPGSFASSVGEDDEEDEEPVVMGQAVRLLARTASTKSAKDVKVAPVTAEVEAEAENPFGDEAEVKGEEGEVGAGAGPRASVRASVDSLASSAALAASFTESE